MNDLTRSRLRRLLLLDQAIKNKGYPNCTSFAQQLAMSDGMGRPFDRKTIQRDIDFLRDDFRAPIEYCHLHKGYYYTDNTWTFPVLDLTEGELLHLLLAERMARQFSGTPLAASLNSLLEKVRMTFTETTTIDPIIAGKQFSFHSHPTRPINQTVWETILKGLRSEMVVTIRYQGIQDEEAGKRNVEPLHLSCVDGEWYLVGVCQKWKALRHFAVSRIVSAALTKEEFIPQDFNPEEYFSNRFGRFIGKPGEFEWVEVRFAKSAAPWIEERIWHSDQKLQKHRDGSLTLCLPIPSMFEARRWVLQWGAEAEVLAPAHLREEVRRDRALH